MAPCTLYAFRSQALEPEAHLGREEGHVGESAGAGQERVLDGAHHKHHGLATADGDAGGAEVGVSVAYSSAAFDSALCTRPKRGTAGRPPGGRQ